MLSFFLHHAASPSRTASTLQRDNIKSVQPPPPLPLPRSTTERAESFTMHTQTTGRPRSRALLSSLPASLTLSAYHSTSPWPRMRRKIQLRGQVLLLSRYASADPIAADKIIALSSTTTTRAVGSMAASLSPNHKFWFSSRADRDNFLTAVRQAATRSASAASRYTVLREIGHGASGTVYLAKRKSDGNLFALKALSKVDVFESPTMLANLVSERVALAEAAARNSPFIVRLADAFESENYMCFVTELAGFGDLRSVLRYLPGEKMPENVARGVFAEAVLGLEEAHRMGYLYRDMKLSNLLMTRSGHVRLADFGIAKRLDVEWEGSSVSSESGSDIVEDGDGDEPFRLVGRTRSFVGTRRYMSPEHLRGGHTALRGYGAPADVWALGVTLCLLLTGEYPFGRDVSARNTAQIFYAIETEDIEYPAFLGEDAVAMLRGLLERDSLQRFDVAEIKAHAWMRGIDWAELRRDAIADVPREDVLAVLREYEVGDIEECLHMSTNDLTEGDVLSLLSESGSDSAKRRKRSAMDDYQLLGFGYLGIEVEA